ncbi:exopolysaccharide biosynthesis polyprenyl glycosylphosphotransferase [Streptomyces sp. NPDC051018]|uniref:exopolysaccharide biosynthesis polyprenyl glycosylphosphotransferase n=1 Tax=Streptomyces sp. NPDC051018 TaxID=3365639 RepID=UPI00378F1A1F
MTTESAPAPHHTTHAPRTPPARTTVRTVLLPPRGTVRRRTAAVGTSRTGRSGPLAGLLAADACALAITAALLPPLPWPPAVLLLFAAAQPSMYACRGLYRPSLSPSALTEVPALLGLVLVQWLAVAEALAAYDPALRTGWTALALAAGAQTVFGCGARALFYTARRRVRARRPQSVLVVGRGPLAQQVTAALAEHPGYGMRPVGQIDDGRPDPSGHRQDAGSLPVLAAPQDIGRAVIQNAVRHAVFTQPPGSDAESAALIALFAGHGCRLWLVDGGNATGNVWRRAVGHDHLWGFSVRPLRSGLHRPVARAVKRAIDTVLAAVALVAAAPVMAGCALAVRLADGPGVIFRQERIGLDGRPFTLLKFRTLAPANEHESATRWNVAYDRRMSVTGSVLRRTSLDELPQLWNVLRGDMSLVGPRPERPYFVAKFGHAHPGYRARHRMPVGITGLAQVNGLRGDTSIEERARFDNHYIETWSPWQDLCIMARTALSLFRLGGS